MLHMYLTVTNYIVFVDSHIIIKIIPVKFGSGGHVVTKIVENDIQIDTNHMLQLNVWAFYRNFNYTKFLV
jgi:hypothetical protein